MKHKPKFEFGFSRVNRINRTRSWRIMNETNPKSAPCVFSLSPPPIRTSPWISTSVNFGRTPGWRSGNARASKRYPSARSSSRTSGCRTHFSSMRNSRTSTLPPRAMSSLGYTIRGASREVFGE
ncbi:unnamed protein product [Nesidiocoris tenuis]|uniref:Uncharacterized protein n=1 Tax=Nesidiocoris tenuis TaxID=355587 RepID=A0A6H5GDX1_9HEMI|nr:unnamed protein product [Nesidiocoris tenuis]